MTNKNTTEIVSQILKKVYDHHGDDNDGEGISQTRITYTVYLNNSSPKEYLTALTLHGLLIYESEMQGYHITEKGMRFFELYGKLDDMTEEQEEEEVKL